MGLAEDLSRLAELKESGVLTQQEFDRQKKRLLNGGKSGPSKLMQFTAGLVAFMIIGSFAYKGVEKLAEAAAEDDLLCDSPEVRETAVNVLNQQIEELRCGLAKRHHQWVFKCRPVSRLLVRVRWRGKGHLPRASNRHRKVPRGGVHSRPYVRSTQQLSMSTPACRGGSNSRLLSPRGFANVP